MGRLKGKVALITGATQGVGEGIAIKFAREGSLVVINGRSEDKGERTLRKLQHHAEYNTAIWALRGLTRTAATEWAGHEIASRDSIDETLNCKPLMPSR